MNPLLIAILVLVGLAILLCLGVCRLAGRRPPVPPGAEDQLITLQRYRGDGLGLKPANCDKLSPSEKEQLVEFLQAPEWVAPINDKIRIEPKSEIQRRPRPEDNMRAK